MNFKDVEKDLQKLIGMKLNSIRQGAEIEILEIDLEKDNLILKTVAGQKKSRPIEELRKIWSQMMIKPAVHVEGVLHGSGTSRNQPETILANLPYIEWLKIDNKKHISYVGKNTHPYGTIKRMDPMKAVEIQSQMNVSYSAKDSFATAIVSKDVNTSISVMQSICNGTISTLDKGAYQFETASELIVFLSADIWGLEEGTYYVMSSQKNVQMLKRLKLYGKYFYVLNQGNVKAPIEN